MTNKPKRKAARRPTEPRGIVRCVGNALVFSVELPPELMGKSPRRERKRP